VSFLTSNLSLLISSRFFGYLLAFINTLIIAKYHSYELLGIYSFLLLIIGFSRFIFLGGPDLLLVEGSRIKSISSRLHLDYFFKSIVLSLIGTFSFFSISHIEYINQIFFKYSLNSELVAISIYLFFKSISASLLSLERLKNKSIGLNFFYFLQYLVDFFVILSSTSANLIDNLIISGIIVNLILMLIFIKSINLKSYLDSQDANYKKLKVLKFFKLSLKLSLANFSFYGIFLAIRSLASINLDVEIFGLFAFGVMLAQAAHNLLSSVNTLIYPKCLKQVGLYIDNKEKADIKRARRLSRYSFKLILLGWCLILTGILTSSYFINLDLLILNIDLIVAYSFGTLLFDSIFMSSTLLQLKRKQFFQVLASLPVFLIIFMTYYFEPVFSKDMKFYLYSFFLFNLIYCIFLFFLVLISLKKYKFIFINNFIYLKGFFLTIILFTISTFLPSEMKLLLFTLLIIYFGSNTYKKYDSINKIFL